MTTNVSRAKYSDYFDKVLGCWLGKTVAGTIGAPFEGRKEMFAYKFDERSVENMLPNDDLDLQVLWLEVMEEKGIYFKSEHLADAFYHKCPYSPGEYAFFKKNYEKRIMPPLSGSYNNDYYYNGMGCAIRSEIWACISPANPHLAAEYARKDGVLDHGENSVDSEAFLAALQAAAFVESDILKLTEIALSVISPNCRIAQLVRFVLDLYKSGKDIVYARTAILKKFGHPDVTNVYQNVGFILVALFWGKGDFIDTTMIALNCGYDTDCTCATAGAVIGIICGGKKLKEVYNLTESRYVLGVDATRRSDNIVDLAEDVCRVGLTVFKHENNMIDIIDCPEFSPVPSVEYNDSIRINYITTPDIGLDKPCKVRVEITDNGLGSSCLSVETPDGIVCDKNNIEVSFNADKTVVEELTFNIDTEAKILNEKNIVTLKFGEEKLAFGINGAVIWKLYGPFWDYNAVFPDMNYWENYYEYMRLEDKDKELDYIRGYHISNSANINKDYIKDDCIENALENNPLHEGQVVCTYNDRLDIDSLIDSDGPCCIYMQRKIVNDNERPVALILGYNSPYKLWLNGELLCEAEDGNWWTGENKHLARVTLKKGTNTLLIKLVKNHKDTSFSAIFKETFVNDGDLLKAFAKHLCDLKSDLSSIR